MNKRTDNNIDAVRVSLRFPVSSAVTVPEFREQDLRIEPSSSSIRLDWGVPEAWEASYVVTVHKRASPTSSPSQTSSEAEPLNDVRIKRAAASATYKAPPGQ